MPSSTLSLLATAAGFAALFGLAGSCVAQTGIPLDAVESDPNELAWKRGFPPPPEKLITI